MVFLTWYSGARKTTLLKLMMVGGRMYYSQWQIYINNRNLSRLSKRQIPYLYHYIGMIFQNPQLLYHTIALFLIMLLLP
nr:hypothetical protein [Candidatus Coxiella mudrowiae]